MSRDLHTFKGGVHPPEHKAESNARPIHAAPLPRKLVIPLRQHLGNPAKPVVGVGERVLKGQMIGEANGYISTAVHASSSGIVSAIGPAVVPHISGLPDECITIETDGRDEWMDHGPLDYQAMAPADLRMQLRDLGLAGLGGAVFPSAVKLDPGAAQTWPTLIINGEFDHSLPTGRKTASLVPGAVHKILPGTGHACCLEDPAGFDGIVIDFLRARDLMPAL